MAVRIITDSTCDLPPDVIADLGITVVPLTVFFGDEAVEDGPELDIDAFYERLRTFDGAVRTSQPSVELFRSAYAAAEAAGDDVVSIHISSRMSGTLNSASVAREDFAGRVRIDLIDSYSVSMGLGLVVTEAAKAAREGSAQAAVAEAARRAADRVRVIAALDTLEYLRRGGRIGRARSLLGALLSIKPILQVEGGEMAPFDRVRTRSRMMDRVAELATEDQRISDLYVAAGGEPELAHELIERIRPRLPHTVIREGRIGPVVGVHSGPGVVGFASLARP